MTPLRTAQAFRASLVLLQTIILGIGGNSSLIYFKEVDNYEVMDWKTKEAHTSVNEVGNQMRAILSMI